MNHTMGCCSSKHVARGSLAAGTASVKGVTGAAPAPQLITAAAWEGPADGADPMTTLKHAMADTTLVDAAWLVELADSGGTLPRCQDVPEWAKVRPEELEPWTMLFLGQPILGVLAISYPWLARHHPDEKGEQLRRIAFVLRAFVKLARQPFPNCKVGVFWDYCSLPQRPVSGDDDRTPEELSRFKRALKSINTWYALPGTYVLLVNTPLPQHPVYTNLQPYECRGWCLAEQRMSLAAKFEQCLVDLSKLDGSEEDLFDSFAPDGSKVDGIVEKSRSGRPPPQDPPAFSAALAAGVADGSMGG